MPPRKETNSSKGSNKEGFRNNSCDMISALPDPIICHILSFLPTKYSVRTSTLSTRWKYLYTQVPVLDFDDELDGGEPMESVDQSSFATFVYRVLLSHNVKNTRKFSLSFSEKNKKKRASHLFSWVSTAIRCNIPEIFVKASLMWIESVPLDVCTSKTLVKLKLEGELRVTLNESMCLPSLKMLHIVRCGIIVRKLKQLCFSVCPVLEDLNLEYCGISSDGSVNIDISLSSLKKLKMRLISCYDSIVLNAPALKFLDYDHCDTSTVSENVLESLVQARIGAGTCPGDKFDGIRNLNKMVSNAYNLSLDSESIQALTLTSSELTRYENLTCLEFRNTQITGWRMLPQFLKSSPYLETLIFADGFTYVYENAREVDDVLPLCECTCLSLSLKEVEFRCFLGVQCDFRLAEYFLKNAKVLDKMILCLACTLESRDMISERLLALPRYSKDCQVFMHNK